MEWITNESTFILSGKEVSRKKLTYKTPIGRFTVFEAVSGKSFFKHPFQPLDYSDPFVNIKESIKIDCDSIEDGKEKCEKLWKDFKTIISKY